MFSLATIALPDIGVDLAAYIALAVVALGLSLLRRSGLVLLPHHPKMMSAQSVH